MKIRNIVTFSLTPNEKKNEKKKKGVNVSAKNKKM